MKTSSGSKITGIGAFLPKSIVTTEELMHEAQSRKFGVSESFLSRASGIKQRRFSDPNQSYGYLAIQAARDAIIDARINPLDIDLILFCGIDRDKPEPSTAHEVQAELGAWNAACLDVSNACIGMLSGYSVAHAYINSGMAENILICTGEKPSQLSIDAIRQLRKSNDKSLFRKLLGAFTVGDGGGAFVVSKSTDDTGCKYIHFKADGKFRNLCYYRHTPEGIDFEMRMEEISGAMVENHQEMIGETYKKIGWKSEEIDHAYFHQVGERPHKQMIKLTNLASERVSRSYHLFGNLTSATHAVNMCFDRPKKGDKVLVLGAGSGASMCQAAFQF
ncbi:ketoacyl-ACP synthase III [Teredinibacter sp. KSP-S5-2]|uniref:3-oxoacyl-ACP synthase III family protein n=1 Tax=Teredinibacter sp. KSP-S5-2 TaxID=3034506 RepID=UPI0029343345|nr:ketoacyl-ACP synthase III [Teredinibacter sp. KSP-S5-2]WNO11061.1 ketoacyl-ACP synthase III [Teredinibacter sp. KSP-S5-2]